MVSKKQLNVNFARNDVLTAHCDVWKRIRKHLVVDATVRNLKAPRLDDHARVNLIRQFLRGEVGWMSIFERNLLPLSSGKRISLDKLLRRNRLPLTIAPAAGSRAADRLLTEGLALVFSPDLLADFGVETSKEFHEVLRHALARDEQGKWYAKDAAALKFEPFEVLGKRYTSSHTVLTESKLKREEVAVLRALEHGNQWLHHILRKQDLTDSESLREIRVGESDTAEGWTDGKDYIVVEREMLHSGYRGFAGCYRLALLLVHEYLHGENDADSHTHDFAFYEAFEQIVLHPADPVGNAAREMVGGLLRYLRKYDLKVPALHLNDAEREHGMAARRSGT